MRICTSPAPGGGGGARSSTSSCFSLTRQSARMDRPVLGVKKVSRLPIAAKGCGVNSFGPANESLGDLAGHDDRDVLAAEAEGIRHRRRDLGVAGFVRYHVERDRRVRHLIVDGWRNALRFQR